MRLINIILADDAVALQTLVHNGYDASRPIPSNDIPKVPLLLNSGMFIAPLSAYLSAIKCFRHLVCVGTAVDGEFGDGRMMAHFAAAGGSFDIMRELDALGARFDVQDREVSAVSLCRFFQASGRSSMVVDTRLCQFVAA
jgi:hypothetical protein